MDFPGMLPVFLIGAIGAGVQLAFGVWVFLTLWRMQTSLSDCAEAQRQAVALQREANQLLRQLAEQRHAAKPAADFEQDWPAGGEYVIERPK